MRLLVGFLMVGRGMKCRFLYKCSPVVATASEPVDLGCVSYGIVSYGD